MTDNASLLNYIVDSLGENGQEYLRYMRLWFRMLITRDELEREIKKYLTNELLKSHNILIISIIRKCVVTPAAFPRSDETKNKRKDYFYEPFVPVTSIDYDCGERISVPNDERLFLMHERVLPDRKFIMRRLYHNALETGLEGSTIASADLLVLATQHFMKNILTAVISRRKGYLTNYNKFIHSITEPVPNPWLKNVLRHQPEIPESLRCDLVGNDMMILPGERMSRGKLEYENVFKLSASDSSGPLRPISLLDLFVTLSIYPSIIASDFLYSITRERIIAKIDHPTVDQ